MKEGEKLLTVKEVTDKAGISRQILRRDAANGLIDAIYFGKSVRFRESDVEEYVKLKNDSKWVMLHCGTKKSCTAQKN